MSRKHALALKPYLFVLIHAGSGEARALRLNLKKLSGLVLLVSTAFIMTGLGTLLFFREVELNRKLQDRLLEIETRDRMAQASYSSVKPVVSEPLVRAPEIVAKLEAQAATAAAVQAAPVAKPVESPERIGARMTDLSTDCAGPDCDVKLALVPSSTGVAQGQLLLILEAEIPRIGAANPSTQVRKRYFVYPGYEARDEMNQEILLTLDRKPFRFSRALHTTANFNVGKLLRPLAVNVYLFDKDRALTHHERRVIETEE